MQNIYHIQILLFVLVAIENVFDISDPQLSKECDWKPWIKHEKENKLSIFVDRELDCDKLGPGSFQLKGDEFVGDIKVFIQRCVKIIKLFQSKPT